MQLFGYTLISTDEYDILTSDRDVLCRTVDHLNATIGRLQRERSQLLAELAPLKAAKERSLDNLRRANEARRAKAAKID